MSSETATDPVVALRQTVEAALAELAARSGADPDDVVQRSLRVAGWLDRALSGPLLAATEPPLATAVAIVVAARDHLRFAEAMEASTLLSAARGQLRRLPVPAPGAGADGAEGPPLYRSP